MISEYNITNPLGNIITPALRSTSEVYNETAVEEFITYLKDESWRSERKDIAGNIPGNLHPSVVLNLVYEFVERRYLEQFLSVFAEENPSYDFSPVDAVRKKIVEDSNHELKKNDFLKICIEYGIADDLEKMQSCYDLAFRLNHPYIQRAPDTVIKVTEFTLNFLWVNLNPQDREIDEAENIFRDGLDPAENSDLIKDPILLRSLERENEKLETWERVSGCCLYKISKWAELLPNSQINLWYDSALVTRKAQQNTLKMLAAISKSRGVELRLRDIRQLPNIDDEIMCSLHPGTPVYYRVDILKALIADYLMSSTEDGRKYCVVSDIDVEPMTFEELFDHRTLGYLARCGYVFNKISCAGNIENSFAIFNRDIQGLRDIHREKIIDRTSGSISFQRKRKPRADMILDSQGVFRRYTNFLDAMGERENSFEDEENDPRKIVRCPQSQFYRGGKFSIEQHQREIFHFIGSSNVPHTLYGRGPDREEGPIAQLIDWKSEPL